MLHPGENAAAIAPKRSPGVLYLEKGIDQILSHVDRSGEGDCGAHESSLGEVQ